MAPKTAGPNWALFTLWIWLMTATATANGVVIMIGGGKTLLGKTLYPELTADVTGGIARFKPIRLDLLARDATCAAEARGANASILEQSAANLTPAKLKHAVPQMAAACGMFD
jgi:hypothetical protein